MAAHPVSFLGGVGAGAGSGVTTAEEKKSDQTNSSNPARLTWGRRGECSAWREEDGGLCALDGSLGLLGSEGAKHKVHLSAQRKRRLSPKPSQEERPRTQNQPQRTATARESAPPPLHVLVDEAGNSRVVNLLERFKHRVLCAVVPAPKPVHRGRKFGSQGRTGFRDMNCTENVAAEWAGCGGRTTRRKSTRQ
jgi:hypothetical protein